MAGAAGAVLSGAPSTTLTLASGGDLLESTRAVGGGSVLAGGAAHIAISLGWGVVLSAILPRRHTLIAGVAAGLAIAAFDLGIVGRRLPAIRALDWAPQVLDHAAYGVVVGAVVSRRRSAWPARASGAAGSTP
ncbi:MAG: hypothetical protein JO148_01220 [Acidimicrobiia bacterium]|nr:hypothetical protein [Acidimicrobiia bacterium]